MPKSSDGPVKTKAVPAIKKPNERDTRLSPSLFIVNDARGIPII